MSSRVPRKSKRKWKKKKGGDGGGAGGGHWRCISLFFPKKKRKAFGVGRPPRGGPYNSPYLGRATGNIASGRYGEGDMMAAADSHSETQGPRELIRPSLDWQRKYSGRYNAATNQGCLLSSPLQLMDTMKRWINFFFFFFFFVFVFFLLRLLQWRLTFFFFSSVFPFGCSLKVETEKTNEIVDCLIEDGRCGLSKYGRHSIKVEIITQPVTYILLLSVSMWLLG